MSNFNYELGIKEDNRDLCPSCGVNGCYRPHNLYKEYQAPKKDLWGSLKAALDSFMTCDTCKTLQTEHDQYEVKDGKLTCAECYFNKKGQI